MNIKVLSEPTGVKKAVLGFSGYPDAGKTIERVMMEIRGMTGSAPVALWDLDGFWNTQSSRPQVVIRHGRIRKLEWPAFHFWSVVPLSSQSVLFGAGPEPASNWKVFIKELLEQLEEWGCEEIILLGAAYDQVFHDEVAISSIVQDAQHYNLLLELGCGQIEYSGTSSIHTAVLEAARAMGIRCLSIWVHLPFYVDGPNELMMAHCLQLLGKLIGFEFQTDHLMKRWHEREKEIQTLIEQNQELRRTLEFIRKGKLSRGFPHDSSKVVSLDEFKRRHEPEPEEE
ncbi:MAG: PAC2 family protein [Syntrophobacteraceae bacterium]